MSQLKKIFLLFCFLGFFLGCNSLEKKGRREWFAENGKKKILCTTAQIADLVSFIAEGRMDLCTLMGKNSDPHSYEIVKGDLEKLQRADLIIYNGLNLEHGASLFSYLKESPKSFAIGDQILEHHPGLLIEAQGVIDPHIWMDLSLWAKAIEPIIEALSKLDPEGKDFYGQKGKELFAKMEEIDLEVQEILQKVPKTSRYLVTTHDAFSYFTRRYLAEGDADWQYRFAAPEGLAPEAQLSPKEIQQIVNYVEKYGVSVLFPESNVNPDSIRKVKEVLEEKGIPVRMAGEPLYGDAMGDLSYFEMMRKNANTIARHLFWTGR